MKLISSSARAQAISGHRANGLTQVIPFVADRVRLAVTQPTKWQRIGNQIDAAMIFARADFVKVL